MGRQLLIKQGVADSEITDEAAGQAYLNQLKKIENIMNTSSPILKVIQLWRTMDEMMGLMGEIGEI